MHLIYSLIRKINPMVKSVVFWHSDISRQKLLKKIYRPFQEQLLNDANKIFVASRNYMDSSDDLKYVRWKCEIVPYGYKTIANKPITSGSKKILSVGRLVYYKGFEFLVRAMAHPSMSDCSLTLIGTGPEHRKLKKLIQQYNLCKRVIVKGHVSDEVLAKYYKECDVFVLPSVDRAEAFGLVLLEAMAHGKPVVTTSIGTATDFIVKDGVNGRVVEPYSPEQLSNAIMEILGDLDLMRKMGAASLERLATEFDIKTHFDTKHEVYRSLVNT